MIVEYCQFGNILDYLVEQRNSFINQLNELGSINPSIETDSSRLFSYFLTRINPVARKYNFKNNFPDAGSNRPGTKYKVQVMIWLMKKGLPFL